jgi:hypothetical protein
MQFPELRLRSCFPECLKQRRTAEKARAEGVHNLWQTRLKHRCSKTATEPRGANLPWLEGLLEGACLLAVVVLVLVPRG